MLNLLLLLSIYILVCFDYTRRCILEIKKYKVSPKHMIVVNATTGEKKIICLYGPNYIRSYKYCDNVLLSIYINNDDVMGYLAAGPTRGQILLGCVGHAPDIYKYRLMVLRSHAFNLICILTSVTLISSKLICYQE